MDNLTSFWFLFRRNAVASKYDGLDHYPGLPRISHSSTMVDPPPSAVESAECNPNAVSTLFYAISICIRFNLSGCIRLRYRRSSSPRAHTVYLGGRVDSNPRLSAIYCSSHCSQHTMPEVSQSEASGAHTRSSTTVRRLEKLPPGPAKFVRIVKTVFGSSETAGLEDRCKELYAGATLYGGYE